MINKRLLGRVIFSLLALATTVGCFVEFFDNKGEKAITMAVLTVAWILAIKCLED